MKNPRIFLQKIKRHMWTLDCPKPLCGPRLTIFVENCQIDRFVTTRAPRMQAQWWVHPFNKFSDLTAPALQVQWSSELFTLRKFVDVGHVLQGGIKTPSICITPIKLCGSTKLGQNITIHFPIESGHVCSCTGVAYIFIQFFPFHVIY
jgi:hypothetical protein